MGLPRTVSKINSDFSRKSQIFPASGYLTPRSRGSPWNWVLANRVKKKQNYVDTGLRKKFDDIFSRLDTIHERDRQTDGLDDSKDRAYAMHKPQNWGALGPGPLGVGCD